jgi:hypothetical protein
MSSHITSRHPAIGSILSAHALTVHETLLGKYSRVDDCHVPEEIFDDQAVKQCNHPLILGFRIGDEYGASQRRPRIYRFA